VPAGRSAQLPPRFVSVFWKTPEDLTRTTDSTSSHGKEESQMFSVLDTGEKIAIVVTLVVLITGGIGVGRWLTRR
jgi:hypothetical protein